MPVDDLATSRGRTLWRGVRIVAGGVRHEPRLFAASVLGSALYGGGTAAGGWALGHVTDRVLVPAFAAGRVTGSQLWQAGWPLTVVALATAVGVLARRLAAGIVMFRLQARYRRAVTRQYLRLPVAWHRRHPAGQLLSNANADVDAIWQVMAPLPMSLGVLVMLVTAGGAMVAADPVLGAVGLLVIPAVLWLNAGYQRAVSPRVTRAQQERAATSTVAHESFEGALVVKSLGREDAETRRFAARAAALRDANVEAGRLRGMFDPVLEGLPTAGTLLVCALGASRVASGSAAVGDVVQVTYLLTLLAFPVRALGWVLAELPRTVVGWDRVSAVLSASGELRPGNRLLPGEGPAGARLDGASFAYDGGGGVHEVTLDLPAGRTVALVGGTGSGKSTVLGLTVRLFDPADGTVLLDDVDVRTLAAGELPGAVALVPQHAFVFDDTVLENVSLGRRGIGEEEVWQALRLAQADGFVAALPGGLRARVGERGTTLSGGQRQRLVLARALAGRPRLLLLDDATSAVDPHVEAAILDAVRHHTSCTVLVVAYRMATILLADEVVWLEGGRVTARGSHADLLDREPGYRAIVTAYSRSAQGAAAEEGRPDPGTGVAEREVPA